MTTDCPACGTGALEPFLDLPALPVLSTTFHATAEDALRAPRGDLRLARCRTCALVWNSAFEPSLVEYTPEYENSQHFSPTFQVYVKELASHLAEAHSLADRHVVEIGCGKGEFLAELCAMSECRGVGFDPTFDGEVDAAQVPLRIERRYYDAEVAARLDPALVMARHVLEHLPDPVGFLKTVRAASGPSAAIYLEVPNADFVFDDEGMWDLIYQHVGYFGAVALESVVRRGGYAVRDLRTSFHGQFLSVEGVPARHPTPTGPDSQAAAAACERIDSFSRRLRARLEAWSEHLSTPRDGLTVLWGAGAKGVAFLNLLEPGVSVDRVVDLNPRKSDRYVPGTGHRIEPPSTLRGADVDSVLILNPAYEQEIREELRRLGSDAAVLAV